MNPVEPESSCLLLRSVQDPNPAVKQFLQSRFITPYLSEIMSQIWLVEQAKH